MKVLLLLVELLAIWIWWTAMAVSSAEECLSMIEENDNIELLRYTKISFNTQDGSYPDFIRDLRNQVKGGTVENILVTKNPSTITDPQKRYLLVELKASQQQFVTLVVNVTDLYVLGYGDKYQGKDRARSFKGYDKIIKNIFPAKGTIYGDIPFGFSYKDLADEGAPRGGQDGSKLGIKSLKDAIVSVSGKDLKRKQKIEAKFLVTAIQMVLEAARFKYIEGKIGQEGQVPDNCAIALENAWVKLSKAIQNVVKLGENFQLDACSKLKGKRKDALKNAIIKYKDDYIGILKYKEAKLYYPD